MKPAINGLMLAVSSSPAASIVAKVTVTTALGLIGAWLARRSRAAVRHALLAAAFGVLLVLPIALHGRSARPHRGAGCARTDRACHCKGNPGGSARRAGAPKRWRYVCKSALGRTFAVCAVAHGMDRRSGAFSAAGGDGSVAGSLAAPIGSAVAAWAIGRRKAGARRRHPSASRSAAARGAARTDDLRRSASCHRAVSGRTDLGGGGPESRDRT
jgi:hypothetical protein